MPAPTHHGAPHVLRSHSGHHSPNSSTSHLDLHTTNSSTPLSPANEREAELQLEDEFMKQGPNSRDSRDSLEAPVMLTGEPNITPSHDPIVPRPTAEGGTRRRTRIVSPDEAGWSNHREPGINPTRVDLPTLLAPCVIQAVDYSRSNAQFSVLTNTDFQEYLDKPRPSWSKVRWLHVNGLSWDVIKPLAIKYSIHPLALEDVIHQGSTTTRSKVDYYKKHLFVSVVVHKTARSGKADGAAFQKGFSTENLHERQPVERGDEEARIENSGQSALSTDSASTDSNSSEATIYDPLSHERYTSELARAFRHNKHTHEKDKERLLDHNLQGNGAGPRLRDVIRRKAEEKTPYRNSPSANEAARKTVTALTKDNRVPIHVEQFSLFLFRDGLVVTIAQDSGYHARLSGVFERIHAPGDILRETEDPGFVLQGVMDVVADEALEIVEDFRSKLTKLEARVLSSPDMSDVRHLHILSAQLLLLKSTLTPLQHLLSGIRLQDDAKAAGAFKDPRAAAAQIRRQKSSATGLSVPEGDGREEGERLGFVSWEAKVYLADVMDHVESVLSSLELFSSLAENLIAYTFNSLSYTSNAYMQALSVLSVIFLPLTFLSGYFGMNFTGFGAIEGPVTYFWVIAIPTAIATLLVFGWSYCIEWWQNLRRSVIRLYHHEVYKRKEE